MQLPKTGAESLLPERWRWDRELLGEMGFLLEEVGRVEWAHPPVG